MDRDTRELDGVIDEVAQAMTGAELRRDLRPAVAARIAGGASWAPGWRLAAATAVASIVLVVAVMPRADLRGPLPHLPPRADLRGPLPHLPPEPDLRGPLPQVEARAVRRAARASVARQRLGGATTADVVEIDPLAILPLETDEMSESQLVEIAPIEVEPVRISQLEPLAE